MKKSIVGFLSMILISGLLFSCSSGSKDTPTPPEGNVTDYEGIASRNLVNKRFVLTNYQKVDGETMISAMDQVESYYKDDTIKFVTDMNPADRNNYGEAALNLGQERGPGATNNPFISGPWNVDNGSEWADGSNVIPPSIIFPFFTNNVNDGGQPLHFVQGDLEDIDTTNGHVIIYVREQKIGSNEVFRSTFQSVN